MLVSLLLKLVNMMMWLIGIYGRELVMIHIPTIIRWMDFVTRSVLIQPTRCRLTLCVRLVTTLVLHARTVPAVIPALTNDRFRVLLCVHVYLTTMSWIRVAKHAIIHVKHALMINIIIARVAKVRCIERTTVAVMSVHVIVDMRMWRRVYVWRFVVMGYCMRMSVMMGILMMGMDVMGCVGLNSILVVMGVVQLIVILWLILQLLLLKQRRNNMPILFISIWKSLHILPCLPSLLLILWELISAASPPLKSVHRMSISFCLVPSVRISRQPMLGLI